VFEASLPLAWHDKIGCVVPLCWFLMINRDGWGHWYSVAGPCLKLGHGALCWQEIGLWDWPRLGHGVGYVLGGTSAQFAGQGGS